MSGQLRVPRKVEPPIVLKLMDRTRVLPFDCQSYAGCDCALCRVYPVFVTVGQVPRRETLEGCRVARFIAVVERPWHGRHVAQRGIRKIRRGTRPAAPVL